MKYFARMRRSVAALALAGSVVAGVIGFVHAFQPDPEMTGGKQSVADSSSWDFQRY
ncbi:hypothetical protein [Streptacidiphilus jiangxiensis]|uniref:Uncharacterized protein n=1 Tax=Streptacidiphilus jiangxiensis TaxID=235985 RepID=A0A1H7WQX0_STRJI|nr:hypothetical protein [Streptacidiphilus jiangxiensis]SEM23960.1 hypothetical protein SAMN05414137_12175 [Streptacidiphilus jiangxiensis]